MASPLDVSGTCQLVSSHTVPCAWCSPHPESCGSLSHFSRSLIPCHFLNETFPWTWCSIMKHPPTHTPHPSISLPHSWLYFSSEQSFCQLATHLVCVPCPSPSWERPPEGDGFLSVLSTAVGPVLEQCLMRRHCLCWLKSAWGWDGGWSEVEGPLGPSKLDEWRWRPRTRRVWLAATSNHSCLHAGLQQALCPPFSQESCLASFIFLRIERRGRFWLLTH